ncbi:hypothetical protein WJX73_003268 [Symbiochloris irregularis]|uniref:Phosphodiesterase n=1 Tax=Symbiochloris irregularis TaxID=706552 RepID=A0AAW1PA41_9CHLO
MAARKTAVVRRATRRLSEPPTWIHRSSRDGSTVGLYANAAALELAGPLSCRSVPAAAQLDSSASRSATECLAQSFGVFQERVQANGEIVTQNVHLPRALASFCTLAPDVYATLQHQPIILDSQPAVLTRLLKFVSAQELRNFAIAVEYSPVHRFMFSRSGKLLFANPRAIAKWTKAGYPDMQGFTLGDLLRINGHRQPDIADEALHNIFKLGHKSYEITLTDMLPNGKTRHTCYKMHPGEDPADGNQPAAVVATLDVSASKEKELELRTLRAALQRQNASLQNQVMSASQSKEAAEQQQAQLQAQLTAVLKLQAQPPAALGDADSPVSHMVNLIDELLGGTMPSVSKLMALRTTLLSSTDPCAPTNLESCFLSASGISEDSAKGLTSLLQGQPGSAIQLLSAGLSDGDPTRTVSSRQMHRGSRHVDLEKQGSRLAECHEHMSIPSVPEADRLLQDIANNWDFDVFQLDRATNGHALSYLAFFLFKQRNLFERVKLDEVVFMDFLRKVELGYQQSNPYHNALHAACVLQHTNLLIFAPGGLLELGVVEAQLASAMLLAALCHDVGHPGVTNDFLIQTSDPLAILYNDKSPLESHHAAFSFRLMMEDDHLFKFRGASPDRVALRATITDLILGTDMKQHFHLHTLLQNVVQAGMDKPPQLSALTPAHRLVIMQCVLKCADLGHLALPLHLHLHWASRIQEEFFCQGDQQARLGLPVTPINDRSKPELVQGSQVGFFEVVALPLFSTMAKALPAAQHLLRAAMDNYSHWRAGNPMCPFPGCSTSFC